MSEASTTKRQAAHGQLWSEASCKYELVDAGFYKVGGPRHDFNLEAFLVHSTGEKGCLGPSYLLHFVLPVYNHKCTLSGRSS